jgi:hypothetical protein
VGGGARSLPRLVERVGGPHGAGDDVAQRTRPGGPLPEVNAARTPHARLSPIGAKLSGATRPRRRAESLLLDARREDAAYENARVASAAAT